MIVLDTNVISEMVSTTPAPVVRHWLDRMPMAQVFTTTVTMAECLYGAACLPQGQRRNRLESAYARLFSEIFAGRVLAFDDAAAVTFATFASAAFKTGYNVKLADLQIASITASNGMSLATRDMGDFRHEGLVVVDPWVDS